MPKSSGRQRRGTTNNTTTMDTRPGQADDGDAVKSIAVGDFVDVTNAEPEVARHVLEAHGWDVDEAVSFYLETGGVGYQQHTGEENGNQMEVDGRHQRRNGTRRSRGASHPIVVRFFLLPMVLSCLSIWHSCWYESLLLASHIHRSHAD
jgi:hypothetical protein